MDILGILGTIFFGLLSIFLFIYYRSTKQPYFYYDRTLLQSKKHPNVKILFDGREIENLTRILVLFCNKGKKEIRKVDIPQYAEPTIGLTEGNKILSASVIECSDNSINMKAHITKDNKIKIDFDYLNYNDGGIVEIFYDGILKNIKKEISFNGVFIGSSKAKYKYYMDMSFMDIVFWLAFALGSLGLGLFFLKNTITAALHYTFDHKSFIFSILLLGFSYILFFTNWVAPLYKMPPKYARKVF